MNKLTKFADKRELGLEQWGNSNFMDVKTAIYIIIRLINCNAKRKTPPEIHVPPRQSYFPQEHFLRIYLPAYQSS